MMVTQLAAAADACLCGDDDGGGGGGVATDCYYYQQRLQTHCDYCQCCTRWWCRLDLLLLVVVVVVALYVVLVVMGEMARAVVVCYVAVVVVVGVVGIEEDLELVDALNLLPPHQVRVDAQQQDLVAALAVVVKATAAVVVTAVGDGDVGAVVVEVVCVEEQLEEVAAEVIYG